jgi:hypothetical protein
MSPLTVGRGGEDNHAFAGGDNPVAYATAPVGGGSKDGSLLGGGSSKASKRRDRPPPSTASEYAQMRASKPCTPALAAALTRGDGTLTASDRSRVRSRRAMSGVKCEGCGQVGVWKENCATCIAAAEVRSSAHTQQRTCRANNSAPSQTIETWPRPITYLNRQSRLVTIDLDHPGSPPSTTGPAQGDGARQAAAGAD